MMRVNALSVRHKLIGMLMVTSGAAVALASGATMVYDAHRASVSMREDLSSLADIAAANSVAAMTFGDVKASQEILEELEHKPALVAAALYGKDGTLFASFRRKDAATEPLPIVSKAEGSSVSKNRSTVTRPVLLSGEVAGFIYVASDLSEIEARRARQTQVLAAIILATLLLAYVIAQRLQGVISTPILDLARTAKGEVDR